MIIVNRSQHAKTELKHCRNWEALLNSWTNWWIAWFVKWIEAPPLVVFCLLDHWSNTGCDSQFHVSIYSGYATDCFFAFKHVKRLETNFSSKKIYICNVSKNASQRTWNFSEHSSEKKAPALSDTTQLCYFEFAHETRDTSLLEYADHQLIVWLILKWNAQSIKQSTAGLHILTNWCPEVRARELEAAQL